MKGLSIHDTVVLSNVFKGRAFDKAEALEKKYN
jgi:hypothetical protein